MKALLLLLAIAAGVWWWRGRQADTAAAVPPIKPAAPDLLDMVRCQHCGMHIPGNEAVAGKNGLYCSADHLRQAEP